MFALAGDVLAHFGGVGFRHRKGAEAGLPRKLREFRALRFYPFGRRLFDIPHQVARGDRARQVDISVQVVFNAIDGDDRALAAAKNTGAKFAQARARGLGYERAAVFGGVHKVNADVGKGL